MAETSTLRTEPDSTPRFADRLAAWRAGFTRPASGFVSQPEPRSIGMVARGRQLVAGNLLLGGVLVEAPGRTLWEAMSPEPSFIEAAHGFTWLDDLAAAGDLAARARAQDWVFDWIARFGRGKGPGWTPDLTGRRLIRWINHALMLLSGKDRAESEAFFAALTRQTVYLSRRWKAAAPGLPRFEALTGLVCAGLALTGMERLTTPALAALARDCGTEIDSEGGIPTRNPEELLEVFTLLTWVAQTLDEAGRKAPPELTAAIVRIAPTLRALRHADGGLARFHSGGRGLEGRLDHALAQSGIKPMAITGLAMGFARMAAGRTTVIVDAKSPPEGRASTAAHASTLAFEMTSGRRPVIVSCGSGAPFGAEWRRAGRATASHSTLTIDGYSSSRLGQAERLTDRAQVVPPRSTQGPDGQALLIGHTGWAATHGLTHMRGLELSPDGRALMGQDTLGALTGAERRRFDAVMSSVKLQGVPFSIRFHLHPEVDAQIDLGGAAVSLGLRSGEIWVFRHDGVATLSLEPSVYLEKGRLKPRATKQIVLSARVLDYAAEVGWTLAKAQDTPLAIRDLERDEPPV
ncbi:heparinase II/III family protein [Gemmobacter nectariphilus]|uniref:heparinase II/III family protein n=1 Tax=Gemmobacter nectariphilus TaxID=220343 RepID=UPI0003FA615D|nr:heparinase II/III family protein [Gemmobacter nectariphilus]